MRTLGIVLAVIVISGCTATYTRTEVAQPSAKLQRGKSVAIATPANGSYEGKVYTDSGNQAALAVRAAFAKFASETTVIADCTTLACLKDKAAPGTDYLVVPEILHWEDRATEWSGIKDKLEIKISIYDSQCGSALASEVLSGKSKWATFGGDHPQDLLPGPIDGYVATLY